MKYEKILQLDPIIHAPTRLAILSILISVENAKFTFLKESIETTDGNLSTHLTKLENSGLVKIRKTFKGKKPQTICAITETGKKRFKNYLDQLEQFIQIQKNS
jgi:DNA-binding transcriptional ArsR family regulator